jgi:hypothetical protein
MQSLVLSMFALVTLASFISGLSRPLHLLAFAPEACSALAIPIVLLQGSKGGFKIVAAKYWLVFGALALIITCSVVVNDVSPGPLLMGARFYLRAIPFFFLPAVCEFDETQIRRQLALLLQLCLLQFPVSLYQRWVIFSHGRFSGDDVRGTVLDSGILSIFLICSALVLTGLYFRGKVSKRWLFTLLFILLLPTSINETKVTALFVPLGFFIAIWTGSSGRNRIRILTSSAILLALFATMFVSIYDLMEVNNPFKKEHSLVGFFTNEKALNRYLITGAKGPGTTKDVRRGDAIEVPLKLLEKDPIHFALGLGMGNTSPSSLGPTYEGHYHELFSEFLLTSFSYFILDIGVLGVGTLLVLYCLLYGDALAVSRETDLLGGIGIGWTAVVVLMCVSLVYSPIHLFDSISYLFWYFSGLVAAHRTRQSLNRSPASLIRANINHQFPALGYGSRLAGVK